MIRIQKHNEPNSWTEYRIKPNATYANACSIAKNTLREALFQEQGHICDFCMGRISTDKSKIAHLLSQSNCPQKDCDYKNMVLCCKGETNGILYCDTAQGNKDITLPLFKNELQDSISYSSKDGEMKSSNEHWNLQICSILNLNARILKSNRMQVLNGVISSLEKKSIQKADITKMLHEWSTRGPDKQLQPYYGIVIWYLKKKVK